jgi:CelD/BcsL family acetyltransferase involved in cellulose biosynthesis
VERFDTSVVRGNDHFELLRDEWNALLDRSRSDSVFLTWDWLYAWWRYFADDRQLHLVIVRDSSGALVGIAPFCLLCGGAAAPGRTIAFLGSTHVSSEYLDIIAAPECETGVVAEVLQSLYAARDCWDCLLFTDLLETSLVYRFFRDWALARRIVLKKIKSHECPALLLSDSREKIFANLKPHLRSTIIRKSRKLEKLGLHLELVESAEEVASSLLCLFQLHKQCWNDRGIRGNFKDEAIRDFHRDVSSRFFSRDMLRLYKLYADGKVVSALYAFKYKNKLFYFQSGYDPSWSSYSPGTVLMWKCIERSVDDNLDNFDYLRGNEHYKTLWTNTQVSTWTLRFIKKNSIMVRFYYCSVDSYKVLKKRIKQSIYR